MRSSWSLVHSLAFLAGAHLLLAAAASATTAQPAAGPPTPAPGEVADGASLAGGDAAVYPAAKEEPASQLAACPFGHGKFAAGGVCYASPAEPSDVHHLTLKSGAPLGDKLNSLLVGPKGPNLLADVAYVEEVAHFNRERIPERVVHAKGAAATGHFEVTSSELSKFTRASLFASKGKRTPVSVRFSHVAGESGIPDTLRDVRGFAVKFYTDQGNWDLVGNNLPVFFVRDPINFVSLIHTHKRNPRSHLKDPDAFWDLVTLLPETLHTVLMLFSERGIPDGFRHMHGYGVNTFKLVNANKEHFFAKFHWHCDQQIRNLEPEQATKWAGTDPDYAIRDLYLHIQNGSLPSWTLKAQVMRPSEAEAADFNVFDVTKTWPTADFPLIEVGKMRLERNADNYFAQVEQLAFSPANMVPGVEPSPDKMLVGRMLAYPDAQRYRLGANYADLPCNQPLCPFMTPTYCDGVTFMSNNRGSLPNYVPSIRYEKLKVFEEEFLEHKQSVSGEQGRYDLSRDDNYSQARVFVTKVLSEESRHKLAQTIASHLRLVVNKTIVERALAQLAEVDGQLAKQVGEFALKKKKSAR